MSESVTPEISNFDSVEVLVDCPGAQGLYLYRIPSDLTVQPGDILSVPFGSQQVGAIAIRLLRAPSPEQESFTLRDVEGIISHGFFSKNYWALMEQVADYYQTPLIQVIRTALPPGLLAKSQRRIRLKVDQIPDTIDPFLSPPAQQLLVRLKQSAQGDYTWQYLQQKQKNAGLALRQLLKRGWVESYLVAPQAMQAKQQLAVTLTGATQTIAADSTLTDRQREILITLGKQGGQQWLTDAVPGLKTSYASLKKLADKGYLVIEPREILRVGSHSDAPRDHPKALTPDQAQVLQRLQACVGPVQVLLHGVTGAGKTEVYLQAIAPYLAQGKSVLVLVPEIGLTPQLTDRFRSRFGTQVCVYHSALSDGERFDTWRHMLTGQPQVVIGTRSAIFAPLPHLGLIILDEEHDSSFKQDSPIPCYHARTVAQWRSQLEHCPLILGSATPALDSWTHAKQTYLSLPQRVHARPLPPVQVVDMRQELQAGNRSIFSRSLQSALESMKAEGNKGLLFIHRRGHSSFVSCRECGYVVECPNCDVSLSYHLPHENATPFLQCHYCGYYQSHPPRCPSCESPYLKNFGSGTQRVVSELAQQFPHLKSIRFDSDTTRTKGAHRRLLYDFAQGEADLLVGTQMLTKGIDLPQITLVGVIAADGLLYMADYWAAERAFQTLTQVAGRAGRGEHPGQVIIQTYSPEHPAILAAKHHDYQSFVEQELVFRQELLYPPYGKLILLRFSGHDADQVEQAALKLADTLRQLDPQILGAGEILGPAPAPILRVAKRYRWHILLKLPLDQVVGDLKFLRQYCPKEVAFAIDVDPLNLS
jgi:primosomal protein N' (replication factor Y) (superfamily II helicase)